MTYFDTSVPLETFSKHECVCQFIIMSSLKGYYYHNTLIKSMFSAFATADAPVPRLCHLKHWPNCKEYGFKLITEQGKPGQFIGILCIHQTVTYDMLEIVINLLLVP